MNSIVNFHLKQETPMWHFQYANGEQQHGAILRGSDVKPRFDRFLIYHMKKDEMKRDKWEAFRISPDHDALNYKIQLQAMGKSTPKNLGEKAFFANMGKKENEKEHAVFYPDGVNIRITCFIPELMEEIKEHIVGFFFLNNFGTRQDKGFGSFSVDKMDGFSVEEKAEPVLAKYAGDEGYSVYGIDTSQCNDEKILDNAYVLYQWMKSGLNFGNTYKKSLLTMFELQERVGGEKRWMKENEIAPKVRKGPNKTIIPDDRKPEGDVDKCKYIRAVMGVSGNQSWVTDEEIGTDKKGNPKYLRNTIIVSSKEIVRFQSPITIKYIGDKLYFIAYDIRKPSRNEIFDKEFVFSNSLSKRKGNLETLSDFNMEDFMDYCAEEVKKCGKFTFDNSQYGFMMTKIHPKEVKG